VRILIEAGVLLIFLLSAVAPCDAGYVERHPVPSGAVIASDGTGAQVSTEWLRDLLHRHILQATHWDPNMMEIDDLRYSPDLRLARRPDLYEIDAPASVWPGRRVRIGVKLYDEHAKVQKRLWASGRVALYQRVWVASRSVRADESLREGVASPQRVNVREVPPGALVDIHKVLGMRARRNLLAGTILCRDQWQEKELVQRGQHVRIVLETASLRVVAPGECLEDGVHGARIRVLNLGSRQVVVAAVRDSRTVQVPF
jgi:flagella basal body P-ring formation protein FlgA